MAETYSFGEWLKQRRSALRLTQREVAAAVYCSPAMIKKIEADLRRPSPELAQALAGYLGLPVEQHALFVEIARGERPLDHLGLDPERLEPVIRPAAGWSDAGAMTQAAALPEAATPFVGRQMELAGVTGRLRRPDCRLLTLLGPGGIGKTRLAVEAARSIQDAFRDGVVFVSLAAVGEAADLPQAIAQALQAPLTGADPPPVQLQRLLHRRQMLLVLDNFEQLAAGAGLLSELLAGAPGLKLLVTSRERLNLAEEWLLPVPALDEAARLFDQVAARVRPDFNPQREAAAVDHICRLVAGHPLALELAASWTRFMTCDQIANQIEGDPEFLTGGPAAARNAPQRHRSLRALFDHSWRLLSPAEQAALAGLSVFRGGFAPEQAAAAGVELPVLLGLADKSLVEATGANRYDLHELTRHYAAGKLTEPGQTAAARQAHFAAYRALAEQALFLYHGPQAIAILERLEQEHDNFRVALTWGLEQRLAAVLALANRLHLFWLRRGYWAEGERWFGAAVAQAGEADEIELCLALNNLAAFIALQGRFGEALAYSDRADAMARRLGEPWPLLVSLQIQGQGLPAGLAAVAAVDEAIALCDRQAGDPLFAAFRSGCLGLKGDRLQGLGRLDEARAAFEQALAGFRALGDVNMIAYPLGNLGRMALYDGRLDEAAELIGESVAIARRSVNRVAAADWLLRLGQVQFYQGDLEAAEANLRQTLQLYEEIGNGMGPPVVLAQLAVVALGRDELAAAAALIRDSFAAYRRLQDSARQMGQDYDIAGFGDALDSVLQAGLVAQAQGEWPTAVRCFRYVARIGRYQPPRPLRERVAAAAAAIRAAVPAGEFAAAAAQELTTDELIAIGAG